MHNSGQWLIIAIFKLIKMSLQKECLTKMAMNELNTGYKIINYVNIILHSCNMSFFFGHIVLKCYLNPIPFKLHFEPGYYTIKEVTR